MKIVSLFMLFLLGNNLDGRTIYRVKTKIQITRSTSLTSYPRTYIVDTVVSSYDTAGNQLSPELPGHRLIPNKIEIIDSFRNYLHKHIVYQPDGGSYHEYHISGKRRSDYFVVRDNGDTIFRFETYKNLFGRRYRCIERGSKRLRDVQYFAPMLPFSIAEFHRSFTGQKPDEVTIVNIIRRTLKTNRWNDSTKEWYLASRERFNKRWKSIKEVSWVYSGYWKRYFKMITRYQYNLSGLLSKKTVCDARFRKEPEEETTFIYESW